MNRKLINKFIPPEILPIPILYNLTGYWYFTKIQSVAQSLVSRHAENLGEVNLQILQIFYFRPTNWTLDSLVRPEVKSVTDLA